MAFSLKRWSNNVEMTKPRKVLRALLAIASVIGIGWLLVWYEHQQIHTLGIHVSQFSNTVLVEGCWERVGGQGMIVPQPNTTRIRCDLAEKTCQEDGAEVDELVSGYRTLQLLEPQSYRVTSWKDGILVAEVLQESPKSHDITLRISVKDKAVTRTWHGNKVRFLGDNVDLTGEWLEERLK